MKIISIDVGILNLAFVCSELENDYLSRENVILYSEIIMCEYVDITSLIYECSGNCDLFHEKTICDYMMHFFKKYKEVFDSVDIILIERQPITGVTCVQELILREYRNKCLLISPTAVLNHFGNLDLERDDRKNKNVVFAKDYLSSFKIFVFSERRHDMADAFCILYYYLFLRRKEYKEIQEHKKFISVNQNFIKRISDYKYNGSN